MKVTRFNELTIQGEHIFDMEQDDLHLKEAAFYLDKKTEDLSDEQFLAFVKRRMTDGSFNGSDLIILQNDLFGGEFPFLQKLIDKLPASISIVIDYAIDANGLSVKNNK